jgi:sulfur carrier protein
VRIQVNGDEREAPDGATLEELVRLLALAPERLAVELNYEVVRRDQWAQRTLNDGDRVEIVHFVGGG